MESFSKTLNWAFFKHSSHKVFGHKDSNLSLNQRGDMFKKNYLKIQHESEQKVLLGSH